MLSLSKVEAQAPALVNLAKSAAVSLAKNGIAGQQAAVYLVVDRSYSMHPYYADGSVQHLADQALGLSVNVDDDGIVPLVFFDTRPYPVVDVRLTEYQGVVARQHELFGGNHTMGGTNYAAAMQIVVEHYASAASNDPALVIFQTDGAPQDASVAAQLLTRYAHRPLFWAFVGFGPREVPFLQRLDTLADRAVDNASYFHAGAQPKSIPDSALYDGITGEFAEWLTAARAAGVL
ncbi:VWA domain-containing protein [Streptomyces sp. enrichment culture]|uniref:VWA domain-containing protein n=1 Tax=Streptomyces sp. enrichment culture TaxID=1795815 RepID=UPI003F54DC2A